MNRCWLMGAAGQEIRKDFLLLFFSDTCCMFCRWGSSGLDFIRKCGGLLAAVCFVDVSWIQNAGNQHRAYHVPFV